MYLPKDTEEMFEIIEQLRVFAETNAMPELAEHLADAGLMLTAHGGRALVERHDPAEDIAKQE